MKPSEARIARLDDYVSAFYDQNIENKTQASKCLLELFQDFNNLKELLEHESLLQVLSRTLMEDHKRNIDLNVYILSMFYILSNYAQFQQYLTENQIGKTIFDVMDNQIQRFDLLYSQYIEMWRKNDEKDKVAAKVQLKKLNILIWKQDKLFYVCLNILLNISSNPTVEKKMGKRGIVTTLTRCLERNEFELSVVTLTFIKKLSVIGEYKDRIIETGTIEKLERFFTCENQILLNLALQIYHNLAFDKTAREEMERAVLIPKLVNLLAQDSQNRNFAIKILYLLSTSVEIRLTLAHTNCMDYVLKLILFPHPNVGAIDLLALAINLSANERNVEHISEEDFYKIIDRSLKSEDATMLKLCKNILKSSKSEELHSSMKPIVKDRLIKMVMLKSKKQEVCLEILGIMAYAKLDKEWTDILLSNDKFIDYMSRTMISDVIAQDLILQTVMLVSNIAQQAECCSLIEEMFESVLSLFLLRDQDAEMTTQLLYCIYSFIFHGIGLERVLSEAEVVMKVMDLIEDPHEGVREMNDEVLTILRETDDLKLADDIKQSKFYQHNKKWLTETEGINDWVYDQSPYGFNEAMLDPRMWESEDDYD